MIPFFEDFLIIDFNFLNEIQLQEDDKSEPDGMKIPLLRGSQFHKYFSEENSIIHSNETFGALGVHLDIQSQYSIPGWADTRWPYRKNITIDASKVMTDLTNFPVLIELYDSDLYSAAQADGDDIVFTNSIGDQLDHEIEVFNPNYNSTHAHLVTWLKSNLSSSQNTLISMYYGNNTVSSQQHIEGVWGGDYSAILHLNDDFLDSTFNNNTGTNNGSTNNIGRIANGQSFDGNDDFINVGSDISIANVFSGGGGTISAWVYPIGWGGGDYGRILDKATTTSGTNGWTICVDGYISSPPANQMMFFRDFDLNRGAWYTPENSVNLNQWQYVVVSYDDSADSNVPSIYINGVDQFLIDEDVPSGSAVNDSGQSLYIGNFVGGGRTFNGTIDEVRMSNKIKSADWIATEFNNQFDPLSFYAIGMQEHLPDTESPNVDEFGVFDPGLGTATFWATITDASGVDSVEIKINGTKYSMIFNASHWIYQVSVMFGGYYEYQIVNASDSLGNYLTSPSVVKNYTFNLDFVPPDVLDWEYITETNTFHANITDSWGEIDTVIVNVTTYNLKAIMVYYTTFASNIFAYMNNTLDMANGPIDFQIFVNDTSGNDYTSTPHQGNVFINHPPMISDLTLSRDPIIVLLPIYSNSTLYLGYTYYDEDGHSETGTEIRWYKNGLLQPGYNDLLTIPASAFMKGDIWNATVKSYDGLDWSDLQTTSTIIVLNTPPVVSGVTINGYSSPVAVGVDTDLVAGYTFTDDDGDPEVISSRKILWYRNGMLVGSLNDSFVVTAGNTSTGEVWYYTIRVFDGTDYSSVVFSPSTSIDVAPNTPPVVSNLTLIPFPLHSNDDLILDYDYYDADGDSEVAVEIRWFKNGLLQSTYNNLLTIPVSALMKGDLWNATVKSYDGLDWSDLQTSTIIVQNTPPVVTNSAISPSFPYTTDDLIASYESADFDNDSITAVSIEWLLDGVPQPEFDNSTIIPMENTSKGHSWWVRVKVFDGEDWSSSVDSFSIFISNSPPSITNVILTGGIDTSDTILLTYDFVDVDTDTSSGTIITWRYAGDGSGTYTGLLEIPASYTKAGQMWWVEITPSDGEDFGDINNSFDYGLSIIIGNTPPELAQSDIDIKGEINGTEYLGQSFGTLFDLKLYYNATDIDGDQGAPAYGLNIVDGFAVGSEYRWYRNRSGVIALITTLNDETTISQTYTEEGDFWWVQIRPRDLYGEFGNPVNSTMISIGNTAPQISNFQWDKSKYYTDDNLSLTYMFFDYDPGDVEQGRIIQWFRNGVYLPEHENSSILSSQYVAKSDSLYVRIQVWDGESYSTWFISQTTIIQNSAPVATNVTLSPISPITSQILTASWIFVDTDGDSESQPIIHWYRNGILVDSPTNLSSVPSIVTNRDESWYFSIQVSDGTNYSSLYISNTVVIINSAPTASNIQINAASATIYTTDPLVVTWDFIDPDPLDIEDISSVLILWYLDGVEQVQFMNQSVISANYTLKNQEWSVSIRVRDNGGLTSDFVNSSVVVVANSPPIINNLALSPSYPNETENLVANWDYGDADGDPETISFITWYKNGVEQVAYMNLDIIPSSETADGEDWYFSVYVSDGTSNSTLEISPHVVIGTSLLVLNIDSPTNITYSTTTISINLSGNVDHFWYFIEKIDTVNQSWTASLDRIIDDGTYTIHAYGNDSVGNTIHVQSTFNIDTTPPELIILSPINAIYGTEVLIDLSGDDDTIWLIYNIEGVNIQNQSWVKPVNVSLSDGYHLLHAYSSDSAGNIAHETISFTVDSIPPIVTIIRPSDNLEIPMQSESIKIVWSVVDSSSFSEAEVLVNGSIVTRVLFPCCIVEITLPEGLHNIEVVVYDLAGNRGSAMITVLIESPETGTDKSDTSTGFSVIFPLLSLIAFGLLLRRRLIFSIKKEE